MKNSRIMCITHVICVMSLGLASFAQLATPSPVLSSDKRLAIRDAQHKRDVILKQQSDLAVQVAKVQKQITDQSTQLDTAFKAADADYKIAIADVCPKDFKLDEESLTCTAAPAPGRERSSILPETSQLAGRSRSSNQGQAMISPKFGWWRSWISR